MDQESASLLVRKCAHFLEYLILGIFMTLSVRDLIAKREALVKKGKLIWFLISFGACVLYSVTDEMHQALVPGRSCELRDMMIDCCGAAIGTVIIILTKKYSCINRGQRDTFNSKDQ